MDGTRLAANSTDVAGEAHPDNYSQSSYPKAHQCLQETLVKEGPTRVLLVDDNKGDFVLTREMLSERGSAGFTLDWESDYDSAKEALLQNTHDVYLIDYRMGILTGLDLLSRVRDCGTVPPAIMLTNEDRLDLAARSLELGATDYLIKGQITAPLLERSIQYAVARHWFREQEEESQALLRRKNQRLSELYVTAHQFVDNVSHEFRTPLAVIKEFASILADGLAGELNEEQREFIEIILSRVDDLSLMVNDMLDISRLETGLLGARRREYCVMDIVERVRSSLERKAVASGVELEFDLDADASTIYCDAENIGRVIINLVVNACKFCGNDGRVRLWSRPDPAGSQVMFGVTDNGPGIGPEHLNTIFERFKQVGGDVRANSKGVGLGLNIAKELVHINFGEIEVDSQSGKGSTFTFTVPIYRPVEIFQRYISRMELFRNGSSHVSLIDVGIDTGTAADICDQVELFVERQLRRADLAFRTGSHSWLVCVAANPSQLVQMIERVQRAHAEANEDAVAERLPDLNVAIVGTWKPSVDLKGLMNAFEAQMPCAHAKDPSSGSIRE